MINKTKVKMVCLEIDSVLAELGQKHGLIIKTGGGTFTDTNFTVKIQGSAIAADGTVHTKEAEDFKMMAFSFGLKSEDLGKTFFRAGKMYEIVGCKTKSYKYPILAKCMNDHKTYKFPAETVKTLLT